jgi:purine-binding chemotaxis protein CheW
VSEAPVTEAESSTEDSELAQPQSAEELLRSRARRLAQPMAAPAAFDAGMPVLSFRLSAERYAIETKYVHSVRRAATLTPLPLAGEHVLGLTNVQGELLVVFDLRVLFGLARGRLGDTIALMILGTAEPELGVLVDELSSVDQLDQAQLFQPLMAADSNARAHVRGVTQDALLVLDGAALLADPRLYVDEP